MIPIELKIFSHIYECGRILTLILAAAWFFYALMLMISLNRRFWLWLLILPFLYLCGGIGWGITSPVRKILKRDNDLMP